MERKHISDRKKLAAALAELGYALEQLRNIRGVGPRGIPYVHAMQMTPNQFISLWEWHHNKFHSWAGDEDPDHFSNLTPLLIKDHAEQTKKDLAVMAKSKRIQRKLRRYHDQQELTYGFMAVQKAVTDNVFEKHKRKIRSRGFDRTKRRKMSGKVVPR